MTDTDSFLGYVQSEDFYKEIEPDIKEWFDTSNIDFLETVNKKVLGMFKDELKGNIITEFVGLRSKMYAYKTEEKEILKCKGITKQGMKGIQEENKEIVFEDYKKALNGKIISTKMNVIRSRNHSPYTETITKKVLDPYDEKRTICEDGVNTLPWGFEFKKKINFFSFIFLKNMKLYNNGKLV